MHDSHSDGYGGTELPPPGQCPVELRGLEIPEPHASATVNGPRPVTRMPDDHRGMPVPVYPSRTLTPSWSLKDNGTVKPF
jgi:hypothetical protein